MKTSDRPHTMPLVGERLPLDQDLPSWDQKGSDIEGLIRPLLEALAKLADVESTYLTVFDWDRREQEVRFVFSAGETQIEEGHRIQLPAELSPEAFPGVTRSPLTVGRSQPDSLIARGLGLRAYISVPVTVAHHRLFGMLCGASRQPTELSETVVSMFESFAGIMAEHLVQVHIADTERRAIAAESQLLIRARFVAEAEHRLKTPLTVLHGTSLTLRDRGDELTERDRTQLQDSLVRNVLLLSDEVERLLVEARAEVQVRESSPIHLELGPMVRELAAAFNGLGDAHEVVADVPHEVAAFVDPTAMYQVLGHLLDNAVKYSPAGGRITVRATESSGSVAIEVIDEGNGLPSGGDVFVPFHRGDPGEQTPGIGLGLHIVRNLVEAMQGTVTAVNNQGPGSTFIVRVPSAPSPSLPAETGDLTVR